MEMAFSGLSLYGFHLSCGGKDSSFAPRVLVSSMRENVVENRNKMNHKIK